MTVPRNLFDVTQIRQDFPILSLERKPGTPLVYLDNGASTQKPIQVIEAINTYYRSYNANVHRGIHMLSEQATEAFEAARTKVKSFINASSRKEIIFTRGTTESINLIVQSWGRSNLQAGDLVVSTAMEHHANIVPWQLLAKEKNFTLKYIPFDQNGALDIPFLEEILKSGKVKIVTVVHMSNVLGTINPIKEIVHLAHQYGALVLVDGAQSVPHLPVDVQELGLDFLAFSGHKMCGPTGIGVLYGRRDLLEQMPPWLGGGDMITKVTLEASDFNELPHKFEAGTPSIAEAIGLGYAIDYLTKIGLDVIHQHEIDLTMYAFQSLSEIPYVTIYGPPPDKRGGLISFSIEGVSGHDIAQVLDSYGVAVRSGRHCAHPIHDVLCVASTTRASFYLYNTLEEINQLVNAIHGVKKLFA